MKKIKNFFFSFVPFLLGIGIQYIAAYFMSFLAMFCFAALSPTLTGKNVTPEEIEGLLLNLDFNTLVMIVFSVSCIVTFGLWYYKSCGGDFKYSFKEEFHPLQAIGLLVMVPGTQFATSLLVSVISMIFPHWLTEYEELMESAGMGSEISILMMIYSVCLAPFSEELIFRGVTMRVAGRTFPFWFANILQALLFGVFHMNLLQGCYAFALGLILGYICEKSGNIYYAIFFHFLFNLWGTTSQWLQTIPSAVAGMLILFGTFVALPLGLCLFRVGLNKRPEPVPPSL